jgi:hypothetical protein
VIAAQSVGTIVEIVYPKTAKSDLRIQQGIDYASEAKTDEWEELNSTVTTTDLVSRKGTGSIKLLRNNKTEVALIEGYADAATLCILALHDSKSDLAKAERTIFQEVLFLGVKGGVSVGGKQEETISFTFNTPIETMAIT